MYRIDDIVHDEAFYIPFWTAPYTRLVHWDHLRFPQFYLPPSGDLSIEYMVYWIDPERRSALEDAMQTGRALPIDEVLDKDYYGVRENPE